MGLRVQSLLDVSSMKDVVAFNFNRGNENTITIYDAKSNKYKRIRVSQTVADFLSNFMEVHNIQVSTAASNKRKKRIGLRVKAYKR